MRISDWSSDVCSSDRVQQAQGQRGDGQAVGERLGIVKDDLGAWRAGQIVAAFVQDLHDRIGSGARVHATTKVSQFRRDFVAQRGDGREIGRASCRERVWQYV